MLGFTSKREGSKSDIKNVTTDSVASSPPIITFVNCTGSLEDFNRKIDFRIKNVYFWSGPGEVLVEWMKPRVSSWKILHYIIYYKSLGEDDNYLQEKIVIDPSNASDTYMVKKCRKPINIHHTTLNLDYVL